MNQLEEVFETEYIDTVLYKEWTSVDRTNLETIQLIVEELLVKLAIKLEALVRHTFIAQQQLGYFAEKKSSYNKENVWSCAISRKITHL